MTRNLKALAGKDLVFTSCVNDGIPGTLMYFEHEASKHRAITQKHYFFVPYDPALSPFRISSKGNNRVKISRHHKEIEGFSTDLHRSANNEELEGLFEFEGILRMNHTGVGNDEYGPSLIKLPQKEVGHLDLGQALKQFGISSL